MPTVGDILKLGNIVEPRKNSGFLFREVDVRVGWDVKLSWELVDGAIQKLIENTPELSEFDEQLATDWFRQYEDIHPSICRWQRTHRINSLQLVEKFAALSNPFPESLGRPSTYVSEVSEGASLKPTKVGQEKVCV